MHYKNGREAKNGDKVMLIPSWGPPVIGILYETDRLPYPASGVSNVLQFRARKNFYATLWPKVTRQWEHGVYLDGVLQNYFIPMFGLRTNIGNG